MVRVCTYPHICAPSVKIQIADLRRSSNLNGAKVQGIMHLIFGRDLTLLAIIFEFPEYGYGGLLALWLEMVTEAPGHYLDFLVWTCSGRGKVVCASFASVNHRSSASKPSVPRKKHSHFFNKLA